MKRTRAAPAPTPATQGVTCPACSAKLPDLGRLDFHLSFACLSRKKEKLVEGNMVNCPICDKGVGERDLILHLDHNCSSSKPVLLQHQQLASPNTSFPPGLTIIPDFISAEEESELEQTLLALDDWNPTLRNGRASYIQWGTVLDYKAGPKPHARFPNASLGEDEMPDFLLPIIARFKAHDSTSAVWAPNNCNAQYYVKSRGDHLTAHYDDRQLSGEIICNISLLSDCIMTFRRGETSFRVRLPRRSASVMTRSARYDYTHEISHQDLLGARRISLNFRQQQAI